MGSLRREVHKKIKNLHGVLSMEADTLAVLELADNTSFKSGGLAARTSSSSSAVVQVASQGWSSGNASTFGEREQLHGEGETGEQKQAKANSQRFCNRVACDIADKADALHAALLSLACQLEAGTGAPGANCPMCVGAFQQAGGCPLLKVSWARRASRRTKQRMLSRHD